MKGVFTLDNMLIKQFGNHKHFFYPIRFAKEALKTSYFSATINLNSVSSLGRRGFGPFLKPHCQRRCATGIFSLRTFSRHVVREQTI